ncbi:MAG TPA: lamin tail domain-containing protein [Verrucomicrobiae bacterium]|nr:lamin tail domain-containing protein [Verrucomicrobiae bacterium]
MWQAISPALTVNQTYTLSYWYKVGATSSPVVVRMSGNWLNTTAISCGDGVTGRIFVDGAPVFQQTVQANGATFAFTTPAHSGSKIDFVLDAGPADNDDCDAATFNATIVTADPSLGIVADSAADWSVTGTQGEKNWYYGYYNRTADPDQTYQAANFTPFPRANGPQSPSNFWDEEEWDWFSGNPPFTRIGQYWMNPNGPNSGTEHWAIRRWVSTVSGNVSIQWHAHKEFPDQNNFGGLGVTVRVFRNGVPLDSATLRGSNVVGVTRTVVASGVAVGDTFDIAVDPLGVTGASDDVEDKTFVTATLRGYRTLTSQIASDIGASMQNVNSTAYLRLPFTVENPALFNSLTLRLKYDDGFLAYLNGVEIARGNAPTFPDWNSAAAAGRSDAEASDYEIWNVSASLGLLAPGTNVLAIHGLNSSASDGDFLILPELLATSATNDPTANRYFMAPTPGEPNGLGNTNLGPLIADVSHLPNVPTDNQNLQVTAKVSGTFQSVNTVRLIYRTMYSNEVNVAMFDDGLHGDGAAGDGTWGASIPASASNPGQMVRYYVFATDALNNSSRFPAYQDPKNSPQYQGTVVFNPALTNPLPVLHFFVQNPTLASNRFGTRCSVSWDEEFFDNIEVNAHGQTTWYHFPKRSMDFNLNTGYKLRWKRGEDRVKAFDLLTTASDKAFMRLVMSFEIFRDAGVPTHYAFPVRVQQNNGFFGVMHFVEQANDDLLERNGLNPNGALYKIYFPLTNAYAGIHKQTRKNEPNDDLQALIDGLKLTGPALKQFLFDNVDVAEAVNFFATIEVVQNEDCCDYKNYYLYRDTGGTGEWQVMPWDLDLTLGRTFTQWIQVGQNLYGGYYDTNTYASNRWYSELRARPDGYGFIGGQQPIFEALWALPDTQLMFLRRWSRVQEDFLNTSNTHPLALRLDRRVDELTAQIAPDAALDLAQWGTFPYGQPIVWSQPFAASVLKEKYLALRRQWIFNTLRFANGGPYLGPQPTNAVILIGDIDYNPASGNQAQEYVQLRNTNNTAIDISGWKMSGAIEHTFRGGTVIPTNGTLYLVADVNGFRSRTVGPRGGQGLFIQGSYKGQLSARGESLVLSDNTGRTVASTNTTAMPSLAQQYLRVTEIMYHPAVPASGLATNADEFEYVEVKNISTTTTLALNGVRFTEGITFNFTGSAITSLVPGASAIVVRNLAAFSSIYGNSRPVAGQFSGQLDNKGEDLRLVDSSGEKILDFSYDPDWYPITDGFGFSLVIVNENALWSTWGLKSSWRPSGVFLGSPGGSKPPTPVFPPVIVTELLTHSIPPEVDRVELYNNSFDVADVGGWYLTDDYRSPRKYRIPDGTMVDFFDYLVLTEAQFHPTNPPTPWSFSFSSRGDEVYLFSGDGAGNLSGYVQGWTFAAGEAGVSFGHYISSDLREHFVAQNATSFGMDNTGPKVGPVVISEIHYHPPDLAGGEDNAGDEFVEIQNITGTEVPLFHAAFPLNTWRLRGGIGFDFPAGRTLGAGATLVVANFDPADTVRLASFRSRLGLDAGVTVLGPFSGKLDNSGDTVKLSKPDVPVAGEVPYILVDQVDYKDDGLWPTGADGTGASLQRRFLSQFGNDPANWFAAAPFAASGVGDAPVITTQPASSSVAASSQHTLSVAANGAPPLHYQWRYNGSGIAGATNFTLTLANLQLSQAGDYSVVVYNHAGVIESSNATLTVVLGAYFLQHPRSTNTTRGSPVTFSALAVSSSPITYQWRFNGTNLTGATSPTLTLPSAQLDQAGVYQVVATDAIGPVPSAPATLLLFVEPFIVVHPVSQTVLPGDNVTLSVTVSNTASLPLGFRWRRGGTSPFGWQVLNSYTSFFTVTNAQPPATNFNVVVTNFARLQGSNSLTAVLTYLADFDGDHLPDTWEVTYGFDTNSMNDADGDVDGDTLSNLQEYIAGTDPLDPASYLKVDTITAGGGATLTFGAVAARTYTIEYSGVPGAPWTKLTDVVAMPVNRVAIIFDPGATTKRFYRVVTPRQP